MSAAEAHAWDIVERIELSTRNLEEQRRRIVKRAKLLRPLDPDVADVLLAALESEQ